MPTGTLTHETDGSGRHVDKEVASFAPVPSAVGLLTSERCYWQINFVNIDTYGRVAWKSQGPQAGGCDWTGSRVIRPNRDYANGKSCARLREFGKTIAEQCHVIKP